MMFYSKEKGTFLLDIYKKEGIPSKLYSDISYHIGSHKGRVSVELHTSYPIPKNKIYSLGRIPGYVNTSIDKKHGFSSKTFTSVKGYSISLSECKNFDDFLANMHRRRRQALARSMRRLNACLEVHYKMYHGSITKIQYNYLMGILKEMIAKRFKQRPEDSETLVLWDKIYHSNFDLINEGKASLYVCYDDEKPIFISLNYHFDKILFGYVSSYDIDYSKFSLGQICIYKHIEWCMSNSYVLFELGWGDLEYKKWWSNNTYNFKSQVIYPKRSPLAFLLAHLDGYKTELIAYLIAKKVNVYFRKFKNFLKKENSSPESGQPHPYYTLEDFEMERVDIKNISPIPLDDCEIPKSIIYDFLFLSQTKLSNISVYPTDKGKNYIISGNKMTKKLVYTLK